MTSSSNDIWAKLVAMNPDKEVIHFASHSEASEFKPNIGWRIYQKSNEEIWIANHSGNLIRIDDEWLEIDEEKEMFGGERVSFNSDKKSRDKNSDYVFCLVKQKPKNKNKRPPEENLEPPAFLLNSKAKKSSKVDSDLQQEATCPICYQIFQKCATLIPCCHTFCSSCLISHFKNSIQCPLCRKEATSITKIPTLQNMVDITFKSSKGEIEKKRKELEGTILRSEDGIFIGHLSNMLKEGKGIMICSSGHIYEGSWKNNKKEGPGVFELKNGDIYEGLFKNGVYHGLGKYIWANGGEYEGNFIDGKKNGFGTQRLSNGGLHTGNWKNGLAEGDGVYISKEGDRYEGSWMNDCFSGKGKYTWNDGEEYEGDWAARKRVGYGKMKFFDGKIYEGEWVDDEEEGNGILTLTNGDKHEGIWIEGILQLVEKIYYANGNIYEGEVQIEGFKKHGKGIMKFKNGDKYEGFWVDDKKHGRGKEISGNGKRVFEGIWNEGTMVDESRKRPQGEWKEREEQKREERKEQDESKMEGSDDKNRLLALCDFKYTKKTVKTSKY